ncbi:DEAD-box ATP-dependent RNA helicase 7-like [Eucalyptus grandis]|uniref:DEAD-box ATP-dependent RNA helicase 7-like n=1 Tax=Eucalyptus grandis TaxID=71139 RepID=UPI00192EDF24|nr:DEAD-box ATP-dependent RNA helicase 7-like [Eucalyptus grandis]
MASVLPILESLMNGPAKTSRKTGYGKPPSVLVLLPTKELAKQVFSDFEVYGGAMGLTSCCLYGGAPGRVKDHIERENIDLSSLTFRVLDEADEMLRMGFVEDVELIFGVCVLIFFTMKFLVEICFTYSRIRKDCSLMHVVKSIDAEKQRE